MSLCYPSLLPFISPISISRQPWQYNFFSIIILRFIYVVACTNCSLLFIVIYYPFYGYAPVCLSTYLSIGIRIISRFWLLLNIFSWAYLEYLFKSLAIFDWVVFHCRVWQFFIYSGCIFFIRHLLHKIVLILFFSFF